VGGKTSALRGGRRACRLGRCVTVMYGRQISPLHSNQMRPTTTTKTKQVRADKRASESEQGPRRRLLAVADQLFYEEGVHVVGIDRLLEEAGVAKASLYTHFGNKDGLVRAYLEEHLEARREHVAQVLARYDSPRERLLGMFDDVQAALAGTAFRGCKFVNASAEARPDESIGAVTEAYRTWLRTLFTDLAKAAGARDPQRLGRQLALLYDGAAVAARLDKDRAGAGAAARSAAAALLDAATVHAPAVRQPRRAGR
jgi:AcrR family transcriptional regulator